MVDPAVEPVDLEGSVSIHLVGESHGDGRMATREEAEGEGSISVIESDAWQGAIPAFGEADARSHVTGLQC